MNHLPYPPEQRPVQQSTTEDENGGACEKSTTIVSACRLGCDRVTCPRETVQVRAVSPERDHLEITFPRVLGYRVELPEERLNAKFTPDSKLELTPELNRAAQAQTPLVALVGVHYLNP